MKNDHQYSGRCFMTKAKMSVEGGVLEKDSVRVSDKIGNFLDSLSSLIHHDMFLTNAFQVKKKKLAYSML